MPAKRRLKLVIFNPGNEGGIARYAWEQAKALAALGHDVTVLCSGDPGYASDESLTIAPVLSGEPKPGSSTRPLTRKFHIAWGCLRDQIKLFHAILQRRPDAVLLASFAEYLAPLWVWLQLAAAKTLGIVFLAVLHDPVRNFVVGPSWWHQLSVRMAYWPINTALVHADPPKESRIPSRVTVQLLPHGLFELAPPRRSGEEARSEWEIPSDAVVFLAFGFIRDSKNLDLAIRALSANPQAFVIVAGRIQSASLNRPIAFYQQLARDIGVESRVRFRIGSVSDEDVSDLLQAVDAVLLTYSSSFRSQSGVLNAVANARKPLLVSSGSGALQEAVTTFGLGEFVAPDDAQAVCDGMARLVQFTRLQRQGKAWPKGAPKMDWDGYCALASWEKNARVVEEAVLAEARS